MVQENVSTGEFSRWAAQMEARHIRQEDKLDKVLEFCNDHESKFDRRLTALEVNQEQAGKLSAKLSAAVSLGVTALAQAALTLLGGSRG